MVRALLAVLLAAWVMVAPRLAQAGGNEFPADGPRNLGRGGAGMARADSPYVMVRNPALLADLWGDQAELGAHLLLANACMRPTGAYGVGILRTDVSDFGDGPVVLKAPSGATTLDGTPLADQDYAREPYPKVCFQGAAPFIPQVGLSMKLTDDLGVGIGFFPPEGAMLNQWGNPDGTVDTPNGRRPNPLRYFRSHLNASFFGVTSGVGYRMADWIRIGAALQWNMVIFEARTWTTPSSGLDPNNDVRSDVFGRDLFIPGLIGSVHLRPLDSLEIAFGFKWSDDVNAKAKIDITSGAFGIGRVYPYLDSMGVRRVLDSSIPTTAHNQSGEVSAGPLWVPQLSVGIRYADRLKPQIKDWAQARKVAGGTVEDSMQNERWDVELDFVYYFTSRQDKQQFTTQDARLSLVTIDGSGIGTIPASPGDCLEEVMVGAGGSQCVGDRLVRMPIGGKDQFTARLGGDYNVLPGLLTVRTGVSYEADGQNPSSLNVMQYMFGRIGLHGGMTVRLAKKTDISVGFAHFIQKDIRLQLNTNPASVSEYRQYKSPEYNFAAGSGVPDAMGAGADRRGPFDGNAGIEVQNAGQKEPGPYFINAGSFYYHLDVLSVSVLQHF